MFISRKKTYLYLCSLLPYFFSLSFLLIPRGQYQTESFLKRMLIFISLFASWKVARTLFLVLTEERKQKTSPQGLRYKLKIISAYALLITAAASVAVFMQVFKVEFGEILFSVCITSVVALGFTDAFLYVKKHYLALLGFLVATFDITLLSFQILAPSLNPVIFLFSGSLSILLLANFIASLAADGKIKLVGIRPLLDAESATYGSKGFFARIFTRFTDVLYFIPTTGFSLIYSVALFLGPSMIVALSIFAGLPEYYGWVYLILPFCVKQANIAQNATENSSLDQNFSNQTSGICLLFVVIIALLSMI